MDFVQREQVHDVGNIRSMETLLYKINFEL